MNARADMAVLRSPPHSIEAESAVLGALMLDTSAWDRVGDLLTEKDFYRHEHKTIFSVIAGMANANKTADFVTVFQRLQALGKDEEVGGMTYLYSLEQYVPSAANLRRYAEIVRECALARAMVAVGDEIAALGFNGDEPIAARIDQASAKLSALASGKEPDDWVDADDAAVLVLNRIQDRADGKKDNVLPTGLTDLDDLLAGGLRPGQVITIGARPGMGKSALAVTIGQNIAMAGEPVGMFSLEMPTEELATRQVSMLSHIHLEKLRRSERLNDADWRDLTNAVEKLRLLPFYISEATAPNINQIRLRARKLKRRHGLKALIVDYVQLASGTNPKDNRNTQLGEVSRGLKALAKELGIAVIVLAQLSRDIEKRTNPRPILSDLKECGDLEQDADVILFIERADDSNKDLSSELREYAEIIVGKQRNGPKGTVSMRYVGRNVQFMDWIGDKPEKPSRKSSGSGL
jgi:replicative DNA helicase